MNGSPEGIALGLILLLGAVIGLRRLLVEWRRVRRFREYAEIDRSVHRAGSVEDFRGRMERSRWP